MSVRNPDAERNIAAIITAAGELFGRGRSPSMGEVAGAEDRHLLEDV